MNFVPKLIRSDDDDDDDEFKSKLLSLYHSLFLTARIRKYK